MSTLGTGFSVRAEAASREESDRQRRAKSIRTRASAEQLRHFPSQYRGNNEERDYPFVANYSKGLPHDEFGDVRVNDYKKYLACLRTGRFDELPLGGAKKLKNPEAALAFNLVGPDSHQFSIAPPPRIDGAQNSFEMVELYWMALLRDTPFHRYAETPLALAASDDLRTFWGLAQGDPAYTPTPDTLFRGHNKGARQGPYLSQFLLLPIQNGTLHTQQQQTTTASGSDFLTRFDEWLFVNNGNRIGTTSADAAPDTTLRYIRNGRDLARYVEVDELLSPFMNACLILLSLGVPFDEGHPLYRSFTTDQFGTFGHPHLLCSLAAVADCALKAAWFQKWYVHRRLRPEEHSARIHLQMSGVRSYPTEGNVFNSSALSQTFSTHGSYLLPQAYPNGCPPHPAYPSGHATVAGACATVLKAWFREEHTFSEIYLSNDDGTSLLPNANEEPLTIGGELDKLAYNIALGRDFAGIHWRSDCERGLRLGESVALAFLREERHRYVESYALQFSRFDGNKVVLRG